MATGRKTILVLAVGLALAVGGPAIGGTAPPPGRGLDIRWVDVEGGAATLLVTPAGESVLVDSGWPGERDAERIRTAAAAAGVTRIDHLITTHWHVDHFGGVEALAARLPIGHFYDHGFPEGAPSDVAPELKAAYLRVTQGRSVVLHPGDTLPLRAAPGSLPLSIRVLAADGRVVGEPAGAPQTRPCTARPPHEARPDDDSDNFRSLTLLVHFGAFRFLDAGDLTWNVEHKLVCPRNLVGPVDLYQVTHHGLDVSNHPALLAAVAPTVAVMNNGAKKGGHPAVYARLRALARPPEVFQVHRNVQTTAFDNAPAANVANDDEACQGRGIHVRVDPDGRHYEVEVEGKGPARRYSVR